MGVDEGVNHVVITPVKDEEGCITGIIESMAKQSIPPQKWIIVDDSSTDGTADIIEEAMESHPWICYLRVENSASRGRGAKIAGLFLAGIESCEEDWEFCSKIDADMLLPEDYFQRIFRHFEINRQLGIASGNCFVRNGGKRRLEVVTPDHTRGGLKTYRAKCYSRIGGVKEENGWDGIDNVMAQMYGWETKNFLEILVEHRRPTGSRLGIIRSCYLSGKFSHYMGYHPIYFLVKFLYSLPRRPVIIGGVVMFVGYFVSVVLRREVFSDGEVIKFLRKRQLNSLKSMSLKSE